MQLNFNAFDFDPTQGGSICFPLADYRLEITKVEPVQVKDNPNAGYLAIHLTCVDGDLKGMVQVDRLNIYNPSEVAKRIALQQLAAYAFAIGRPQLATSEQMLGGKLICTIGPQADNPKYSEVKMIKCPDGSLPVNPNKAAVNPHRNRERPPQQVGVPLRRPPLKRRRLLTLEQPHRLGERPPLRRGVLRRLGASQPEERPPQALRHLGLSNGTTPVTAR
jgi:hypothetical protein